ncbi:MAG: right-handed parallel beta-helix repeat-containing protein [Thermoplasmata archaeon]|nr:right-handed parallel beta-helix repeat-containing protein [Thermoplasmata archaeon]
MPGFASYEVPASSSPAPPPLKQHGPIRIDERADLTRDNGVASGSGTETDPYVIENLEIYANSTPAIWVGSPNLPLKYIKIRNCVLHGNYLIGGFMNNGIQIDNSVHIIIENNLIEGFYDGILLTGSRDVVIRNNVISSGYACIELDKWFSIPHIKCEDVRILSNELRVGNGVIIQHADTVKIVNNDVQTVPGGRGILTGEVTGLTVFSNNFLGDLRLSLSNVDNGEIYHNNFLGNGMKGISGECIVEIGIGTMGTMLFYNATLKEGNYWYNWDGNDWGTMDAYPINKSRGYSDLYPLNRPLINTTISVEVPDKLVAGTEYTGKITVKDANGQGIPDVRILPLLSPPQWASMSVTHCSENTDQNGVAEFKISLKDAGMGRNGRALFTVSCSKTGFMDAYFETYLILEEGKNELTIIYSSVILLVLLAVIIAILVFYIKRKYKKSRG